MVDKRLITCGGPVGNTNRKRRSVGTVHRGWYLFLVNNAFTSRGATKQLKNDILLARSNATLVRIIISKPNQEPCRERPMLHLFTQF